MRGSIASFLVILGLLVVVALFFEGERVKGLAQKLNVESIIPQLESVQTFSQATHQVTFGQLALIILIALLFFAVVR